VGLLRTPSGQTVVLDAGTRAGYDAYTFTAEPFLRHQRLTAPSRAFVSHANTDHYNALAGFLPRLGRVHTTAYYRPETKRELTPPAQELLHLLDRRGVEVDRLCTGDQVVLDSRTRVEVLWPPPDRSDLTTNDTSLVLRIRCDDKTCLVPGDISTVAQAQLAAAENIRADVLVLPHHGAWTPSLPEFVAAVDPEVVLVSNSWEPSAPAGAGDSVGRFYNRLRRGYRYASTARNGWIRVRFGAGRIGVRTMHPHPGE
jgi:competence protein ComEC